MITYDELNQQNHKITELSNVLAYLIQDRAICDNNITCDIFFQFVNQVKEHLDTEDKNLYGKLLTHAEKRVSNTAGQFMSGSQEVKKIFASYVRKWCKNKKLKIKNHADFVRETEDMLSLVLNRIQDETERLYPLVREINGDNEIAA